MTRSIITAVSEAIDAELIALDLKAFRAHDPDGERLAIAAIRAVAAALTEPDQQKVARDLRLMLWDAGA
jgi:hypothetical protein